MKSILSAVAVLLLASSSQAQKPPAPASPGDGFRADVQAQSDTGIMVVPIQPLDSPSINSAPRQSTNPKSPSVGRYIWQQPAPHPIKQRYNPIYVDRDGRTWIARRVGLFGWHVKWFPLPSENQ